MSDKWLLLSGRNVILSFASKDVINDEKERMAKKLLSTPRVKIKGGKPESSKVYEDSDLTDFVDEESCFFSKPVN